MRTRIINISRILHIDQQKRKFKRGSELGDFPITENAWLEIENGKIADYGPMETEPGMNAEVIDAKGGMVLPTWTDSHTHLVYAGTREDEFAQRLHGLSYAEIAAKGGGILNSARKLRESSEDELYESSASRLDDVIKMGTGTIEIKSGYGLTTESEIKMLKVARRLAKNFPVQIKNTFLGAHAIPEKFKNDREGYIQQIIDEMMPEIASQKLADYVDVFCEDGYFTVAEMERILEAGNKYNLRSKLHLNQFTVQGSIAKAISHNALSVDHLEVLGEEGTDEARLLGNSDTIATLLPGCSLFLEIPFAPVKRLIDSNAIIALATDYNPGSAPSGNMNLIVSLACIKMKMTPEQAISAATLNGAAAIELSDATGSIEKGKRADLIITKPLKSQSFLPYNFGHNHIGKVLIEGKPYVGFNF